MPCETNRLRAPRTRHPITAWARDRSLPPAGAGAADRPHAATAPPASAVEITLFAKVGGPLTKRIRLDGAGNVVTDGSACVMAEGRAERVRLAGPEDFA